MQEDIAREIERLYRDKEKSAARVASILGLPKKKIYKFLHDHGLTRTPAEQSALAANKQYYRGMGGIWQSSKTGCWHPAASSYELVRMQQLDTDATIKLWNRDVPRIPYSENRIYVPDFFIEYYDGRVVVEEVKPEFAVGYEINQQKWQAARKYLNQIGYEFRVVTEAEIGWDAITEFEYEGLNVATKENLLIRREKYKQQNLEKSRAWHKEARLMNPEKYKEKDLKSTEKRKEKRKIYRKEYYYKNQAESIAKSAAWQEANKVQRKQYLHDYHINRKQAAATG